MSLKVVRLSSFADATLFWEQKAASDSNATIFSTPEWLKVWWLHHHSGRELLLLVTVDGGIPVGVAPLMIERVVGIQRIMFVGTGLSDYADFLVDESKACRHDVIVAVFEFLAKSFPRVMFDFQQIPQGSPSIPIIKSWLQDTGLQYKVLPQDICPVAWLPDTPEAYHKQIKKTFLADIRRGERRLRELGAVKIVDHMRPLNGDWSSLWERMVALQSQRMLSKGQIPMWNGPLGQVVKDVLSTLDRAGRLRLTGLFLDDQLIAYELCLLHNRTIYAWSRAFSEEYRNTGPGKIALLHLLEKAIEEGYKIFDLLRGDEPYKALWTNGTIQNYRISFVVRPSLGVHVAYKYITEWKAKLQKVQVLRHLYRLIKSLRGGSK